jgi:hypothetical protein
VDPVGQSDVLVGFDGGFLLEHVQREAIELLAWE